MFLQSIKMAVDAILSNKMRSFLTMLGIIIGVFALVVLVSLVSSATSTVQDQISGIGSDMLTVRIIEDNGKPLKLQDLEKIAENENIGIIAPDISGQATAKFERESISASITGTTPDYFTIQALKIDKGRLLKSFDVENHTPVAVISSEVGEKLFEGKEPVGKKIMLDGVKYEIVGVLEKNESFSGMMTSPDAVYVPITTAQRLMNVFSTIPSFVATAAGSDTVEQAEAYLKETLVTRFGDEDAIDIMNMNILADTMDQMLATFSLLLGGIAAISLLVGGIGIMNIMLVSVTERTREIGIRKAIGARRSSIMSQFLIEALVLSLMGCIIGIVLSGVTLIIIGAIAGESLTISMSPTIVMLSAGFSIAIGLLFGLYPANKAAKMRPIDALRYE